MLGLFGLLACVKSAPFFNLFWSALFRIFSCFCWEVLAASGGIARMFGALHHRCRPQREKRGPWGSEERFDQAGQSCLLLRIWGSSLVSLGLFCNISYRCSIPCLQHLAIVWQCFARFTEKACTPDLNGFRSSAQCDAGAFVAWSLASE